MYDYADDEVALVGWETFVTRQWESIFAGYPAGSGLRRSARRWADLLIGGASLPMSAADALVRAAVLGRPDLSPEDVRDPDVVRGRMLAILDAMVDALQPADPLGAPADAVPMSALVTFLHQFADADM